MKCTHLQGVVKHLTTSQISEDDMRQVFKENKRRKAPGPDNVSPACLKTCADQLAPSCAKSPHASNAPPSSPSHRNPKLLDLMTTDPWL